MPVPELLAPAGSFECIRAACDQGADAVYVGVGPHNLRARSANFSVDEFKDAAAFCKTEKLRMYAALNSMPDDNGLEEIGQLLDACLKAQARPDAFIVSDPGVLVACKRFFANVPVHLSTQTGTFNSASAEFWKQCGIARIILPRELSIKQIGAITKKANIETEVFIHGAMCVSISGRCLLGAYLGKRHPNRGDCPQPCRLRYRIVPEESKSGTDEWLTIEEETEGGAAPHRSYILNSKDLNTLPLLPGIIAAGVTSLKIEGRNKSSHYVGSTVKIYRAAIDSFIADPKRYRVEKEWVEELERLDHRPYTTGFYGDDECVMQEVGFSQTFSSFRIVGIVKAITEDGNAVVDVKNPFGNRDVFNVLPVKRGGMPYSLQCDSLTDVDHNPIDRAITNRIVFITAREPLRVGDMLRREDRSRRLADECG
jgi:putative protease